MREVSLARQTGTARGAAALLLAALVWSAAGAAYAQEPPAEPIELPGVEVVSEAPDVLHGVAGSRAVLGPETLERDRPAAAGEILRQVAGVHVRAEDGFGLLLNVGLRGLDPRRSSRTLLLEDGAPIHLGPYGDPSARYHPAVETLERVEVLKGSGQILQGPHTVGGVVNFVTAPPPSRPEGALTLTGGNRDRLTAHLRLGGTRGRTGAALDVLRKQGDGLRAGDRHELDEVIARVAFGTGTSHALSLKSSYHADDTRGGEAALRQAEFEADPFASPFRHNAYRLRRFGAQAVHGLALGNGALLRTNVYAQHASFTTWRQAGSSSDRFGSPRYAEAFRCPPGATGPEDCGNQGRPRTYVFWGVEPRLTLQHRLLGLDHEAELGVRLHHERVERRQFTGERPDARSGEITRDNGIATDAVAAFAQSRTRVGSFAFLPGIRLEHVRSRNENRLEGTALEDGDTRWLPGLGLAYEGLRGVTLFGGVHRGFAPPRPAEVLDPRPGAGLVQVDPEVSWNSELGLRARPAPHVEIAATAFRVAFDNQVVPGDLAGSGQTFVNAGRTVHEGLELSGSLSARGAAGTPEGPFARAAWTWLPVAEFRGMRLSSVDGATPIAGNRLPYAPQHLLGVAAGWAFAGGLELRLEGEHVGGRFADDLETVEGSADGQRGLLPAYTLLHATANLALPDGGVTLFASVKNLTDRLYIADRQEGIVPGLPRRVIAGASWGF